MDLPTRTAIVKELKAAGAMYGRRSGPDGFGGRRINQRDEGIGGDADLDDRATLKLRLLRDSRKPRNRRLFRRWRSIADDPYTRGAARDRWLKR
jgi:hypothetical protein